MDFPFCSNEVFDQTLLKYRVPNLGHKPLVVLFNKQLLVEILRNPFIGFSFADEVINVETVERYSLQKVVKENKWPSETFP